jgi:hypothetical protein
MLGIVACSIIIFQISHTDWDLYKQSSYSLPRLIVLSIPYLWGLFLVIFIGFSYYYFRRTEKGYRYNPIVIILLSVFISGLGGKAFYDAGFSEKLEKHFQEKIPFYNSINLYGHRMWRSPDKGLMAGEIVKINSTQEIELLDLQGKRWRIGISHTVWRGRLKPEVGLLIKLIGKKTGDDRFTASEIRPMNGRGDRNRIRRFRSGR